MPDQSRAMELMQQLDLGYGNESEFGRRATGNNPNFNPEKAAKFREALETEKEANRVLKEMKRDQAIEKAREFVREGKSAFAPKSGGGVGGSEPLMRNKTFDRNPTFKKGGNVSTASKRADGCAIKGKTRGRII